MNAILVVLALACTAQAAPQFFFFNPGFRTFALPTVLPDGHLADTPEVAAAKSAHFAEVAKATDAHFAAVAKGTDAHFAAVAKGTDAHFAAVDKARSFNQFSDSTFSNSPSSTTFFNSPAPTSFGSPVNSYQALSNPAAGVVVNPDGFLADSADVSRAKAIHYSALAQAVGAPTDPYTRYLSQFS